MNADRKLIAELTEYFKECPAVERAVLFGSRARGDNHARSDYDIAVYGDLSRSQIAALALRVREELPTLHKVDLVFMREGTSKPLSDSVEKEGITIYDKETSK